MTTITLNLDDEALEILSKVISVRFAAGASGPVEDMLLSILSSLDQGADRFLIAGHNSKVIVEAIE